VSTRFYSRRQFLIKAETVGFGLAGILASGCAPGILSGRSYRPNIVLITIDTLRADHLGCYGYHRNTSPNMDAFAENNILFENFFTVVPVTGPSTSSLFTGRHMLNHGVIYNWLKRDYSLKGLAEIIPEDYRKAGFTANRVLHRSRGYARGFGDFLTPDTLSSGIEKNHTRITTYGTEWLGRLDQKDKFFLWLHYIDPHGPYIHAADFDGIFLNDEYYDPSKTAPLSGPEVQGMHPVVDAGDDGCHVFGSIPRCASRWSGTDEVDYYVAQYDAEIRFTDREIGKVLDFLDSKGLMEDTIVAISADHGESLGENDFYFQHSHLVNEGNIHIPLIVRHPEVKGPLLVRSLLQNTDLAPTILGELGLEFPREIDGKPTQMDGIDFSETYKGRNPDLSLRPFVYSSTPMTYGFLRETVRTFTGKMITTCPIEYDPKHLEAVPTVREEDKSFAFYDLEANPLDLDDVISDISDEKRAEFTGYMELMKKILSGTVQASDPGLSEKDKEHLRALGYLGN